MKSEIFFDAVTLLPEEIVEEAQNYRFRKKQTAWRTFGSLAACMVLVVSLAMLAALPRGCGASGGNDSGSQQATDSCAPADTAAPESGDTSLNSAPQDTPVGSESSAGGAEESVRLTAIVLEVREDVIVVTPVEYDSNYEIEVTTVGLDVPDLVEGDTVLITYDGQIQETYPARIVGAQTIEKTEE